MPGDIPNPKHPKMILEDGEQDDDEEALQHQLIDAGIAGAEDDQLELNGSDEDNDLDPNVHSGWLFIHESDSECEMDEEGHKKASTITRTRICEDRIEYQELEALGLVERPQGCAIGIHPGNEVWRASASGGTFHGRSYSATSGRTARQALLRVVQLMLQDHVEKNPKDRLAKGQLQRVNDARAKEPKHKD